MDSTVIGEKPPSTEHSQSKVSFELTPHEKKEIEEKADALRNKETATQRRKRNKGKGKQKMPEIKKEPAVDQTSQTEEFKAPLDMDHWGGIAMEVPGIVGEYTESLNATKPIREEQRSTTNGVLSCVGIKTQTDLKNILIIAAFIGLATLGFFLLKKTNRVLPSNSELEDEENDDED